MLDFIWDSLDASDDMRYIGNIVLPLLCILLIIIFGAFLGTKKVVSTSVSISVITVFGVILLGLFGSAWYDSRGINTSYSSSSNNSYKPPTPNNMKLRQQDERREWINRNQ